MIWNFHVYYHFLMFWHVFLSLLMFWHYITATPLCLGMYYYNLPRSLSLCVFQWIATFWHFGRYNYYFLTFFLGGGNVFLPHTLLWECITITHWCFGIYYYHFLTFWNALVYCHFLVFLESISTNFDVLEYTITLQWYYFLAFWNAFLPLHDHYQFPNELSLCRFGMYIYFLRHFGIYH